MKVSIEAMPTLALAGKVAWITGGGSGIGLAAGVQLAGAGACVLLSGRSPDVLKAAVSHVGSVGECQALTLDVSNADAVTDAAAQVLRKHGRIDILVNSAGINVAKRHLHNTTSRQWDEVVGVNLSGLFYCCHAVLPGMRDRGSGHIINISSWAGRYNSPIVGAAYAASKRAVLSLTETINMEESRTGIRATAILPGEVATPILDRRPVPPPAAERARMLQAEDVARAIAFVAALPDRACVNELVISPTWNRFYVGGLENDTRWQVT